MPRIPDHACEVSDLTSAQAKAFFLKPRHYSTLKLPAYIDFTDPLAVAARALGTFTLDDKRVWQALHACPGANYTMLRNKNEKFVTRGTGFTHPLVYVSLINQLTEPGNWEFITARFKEFRQSPNIRCISMPVVNRYNDNRLAQQIMQWWHEYEQASLRQAIEYRYMYVTDIKSCYDNIVHRHIATALRGNARGRKTAAVPAALGDAICKHLRCFNKKREEVGLPIDAVLMDFLAEILLGHIDTLLARKLANKHYLTLRYRDDYRIFVNDKSVGELAMNKLRELLGSFDLGVNEGKTQTHDDLILGAVKREKLAWRRIPLHDGRHLDYMMKAYQHAREHPNSAQLMRALVDFHETISKEQHVQGPVELASIVTNIALRNPRTCCPSVAVLSALFRHMNEAVSDQVMDDIIDRFTAMPNPEYMMVWLQRIKLREDRRFTGRICQVVNAYLEDPGLSPSRHTSIWDHSWIGDHDVKAAFNSTSIIDVDELVQTEMDIHLAEANDFHGIAGY